MIIIYGVGNALCDNLLLSYYDRIGYDMDIPSKSEGILEMIITDEKLEMYKADPYKLDYDSGYHCASIDAWNEDYPKSFKMTDSKAYRNGYRQGWAYQKAYIRVETIDASMQLSKSRFKIIVEEELEYVTAQTNLLAECPDEECNEYSDNWREVIALLERERFGNKEGLVKLITKEDVTYDKSKG